MEGLMPFAVWMLLGLPSGVADDPSAEEIWNEDTNPFHACTTTSCAAGVLADETFVGDMQDFCAAHMPEGFVGVVRIKGAAGAGAGVTNVEDLAIDLVEADAYVSCTKTQVAFSGRVALGPSAEVAATPFVAGLALQGGFEVQMIFGRSGQLTVATVDFVRGRGIVGGALGPLGVREEGAVAYETCASVTFENLTPANQTLAAAYLFVWQAGRRGDVLALAAEVVLRSVLENEPGVVSVDDQCPMFGRIRLSLGVLSGLFVGGGVKIHASGSLTFGLFRNEIINLDPGDLARP
jgi:hypothetical protein